MLNTTFLPNRVQAIAVKFKQVNFICMYNSHNININVQWMQALVNQTVGEVIIAGDLNAQNLAWGSTAYNLNGNNELHFLNTNVYVFINDGSPTRFTKQG